MMSRLERQTLTDRAARRRLAAEGVNLDRLPSERDFLVPMRTGGHGTHRQHTAEVRSGNPPCPACKDAHARRVNPDTLPPPDFADEQWGRLG